MHLPPSSLSLSNPLKVLRREHRAQELLLRQAPVEAAAVREHRAQELPLHPVPVVAGSSTSTTHDPTKVIIR
jgi:hypothetical protein